MLRPVFSILFCAFSAFGFAQTLGGQAAFAFLKLPPTPLLTAAGGVNVSYKASEVGLTAHNPALLHASVSGQISSSFNNFFAGAKAYSLTGAVQAEKQQTLFGAHVHYVDYGRLPLTDAAGNQGGEFRPVDFVVQVSAARHYLDRWTYGLTLKFINASYGQFRSNAIAADVGLLYTDTARLFSASLLVKNMGTQLSTYAGEAEELPFDLQVGFTKRLSRAPFGFSVTGHHLQKFDIFYDDTAFNRDNNFAVSSSTFSKLAMHLVLAAHVYAGPNLEATVGYNFLRRQELSTATGGNGLTGFSAGLRARFRKLQVMYARSAYQRGVAANQIGLTVHLNELFGLGQ